MMNEHSNSPTSVMAANNTFEELQDIDGGVDYDVNPTQLYVYIENRDWKHAVGHCKQNPTEASIVVYRTSSSNSRQMRWRQLPLHAAMVFKASSSVVKELLLAYPDGARVPDDLGMLPCHLAFRYNASETVINLLLEFYPDCMTIKDKKGRVPFSFVKSFAGSNADGEAGKKLNLRGYLAQYVGEIKQEITAEQNVRLQSVKDLHQEELQDLKAYNEKKLSERSKGNIPTEDREEHEVQLEKAKQQHEKEMQELKLQHKAELLEGLKLTDGADSATIAAMKAQFQDLMDARLQKETTTDLDFKKAQDLHEQQIQAIKDNHEKELRESLKRKEEANLQAIQDLNDQYESMMNASLETETKEQKEIYDANLKKAKALHDKNIRDIEEALTCELKNALKKKEEAHVEQSNYMRDKHASELRKELLLAATSQDTATTDMKTYYEALLRDSRHFIEAKQQENEELKACHENSLKTMEENHSARVNAVSSLKTQLALKVALCEQGAIALQAQAEEISYLHQVIEKRDVDTATLNELYKKVEQHTAEMSEKDWQIAFMKQQMDEREISMKEQIEEQEMSVQRKLKEQGVVQNQKIEDLTHALQSMEELREQATHDLEQKLIVEKEGNDLIVHGLQKKLEEMKTSVKADKAELKHTKNALAKNLARPAWDQIKQLQLHLDTARDAHEDYKRTQKEVIKALQFKIKEMESTIRNYKVGMKAQNSQLLLLKEWCDARDTTIEEMAERIGNAGHYSPRVAPTSSEFQVVEKQEVVREKVISMEEITARAYKLTACLDEQAADVENTIERHNTAKENFHRRRIHSKYTDIDQQTAEAERRIAKYNARKY